MYSIIGRDWGTKGTGVTNGTNEKHVSCLKEKYNVNSEVGQRGKVFPPWYLSKPKY